MDNLLNSVLYVIMGLSFTRILQMPSVILLSLAAIVCNLLARGGSVFCSTFFMGDLPDSYDRKSFTELFTWAGLKGGLCIALAMSTTSMMSTEDYHIVLGCTYAIVFFTTILLLTAAGFVLLWQGSGTILGFAKTLLIGVALSMFVMLVLTKILLKTAVGLKITNLKLYCA